MCPQKTLLVIAILIVILVVIISYNYCVSNRKCAEKFVSENCKSQYYMVAPDSIPIQQPSSISKHAKKNDKPEQDIIKLAIYHMPGCGHCHRLMKEKQNGLTPFELLSKKFNDDKSVQILDFEYGKDSEADKYNAFPVIKLITPTKEIEYRGTRSPSDIETFIKKNRN